MAFDVPLNPTPRVVAQIFDRLRNRPGLDGVVIARHLSNPDTVPESMVFIGATDEAESETVGNLRMRHSLTLRWEIFVNRVGGDEDTAVEVQERCYEILREVDREFRGSTAGATLTGADNVRLARSAKVGNSTLDVGWTPTGSHQAARLQFEIKVEADTQRG